MPLGLVLLMPSMAANQLKKVPVLLAASDTTIGPPAHEFDDFLVDLPDLFGSLLVATLLITLILKC
jgi:hypothetical protein